MDVKYYKREIVDFLLLTLFWFIIPENKFLFSGEQVILVALLFAFIYFLAFKLLGIYRGSWQYFNFFHYVILLLVNVLIFASVKIVQIFLDVHSAFDFYNFSLLFMSASFLLIVHRLYWYFKLNPEYLQKKTGDRGVILYGAGTVALHLLRDLSTDDLIGKYHIVTIVDNNPEKIGTRLGPYKVLSADDLPGVVKKYSAKELWLTMPVQPVFMKSLLEKLHKYQMVYKVVPRKFTQILPDIRTLRIEDLIKRPEIKLSRNPLAPLLSKKRILITGAAGSIGSEIARQVLSFDISRVVLVDQAEYGIYELEGQFENEKRVSCVVADIRSQSRIRSIINSEKPQIVFHAAAYKHVPIMERNYVEAIQTNIIGTHNLLLSIREFLKNSPKERSIQLVNISTDKAVSPQSIMGVTKRLSELLAYNMAGKLGNKGELRTVSLRFGNVLSSSGSVVPLFWKQIQQGGPITVTDENMERFFMTIPEAVNLVLHSINESRGDDILALDMGNPVRIMDLAERLILLSGNTPHTDIPIEFVGMRPGEKLKEELFWTKNSVKTDNPYVFRSREDLKKINPAKMVKSIRDALKEDYSLSWWKTFLKQFS